VDGPSQVRAFLDGKQNHHMDGVKSNMMFNNESKGDFGKAIIKFKDPIAALNLVSSGRNTANDDYCRIGSASRGRNPGRGGQRDGQATMVTNDPMKALPLIEEDGEDIKVEVDFRAAGALNSQMTASKKWTNQSLTK